MLSQEMKEMIGYELFKESQEKGLDKYNYILEFCYDLVEKILLEKAELLRKKNKDDCEEDEVNRRFFMEQAINILLN